MAGQWQDNGRTMAQWLPPIGIDRQSHVILKSINRSDISRSLTEVLGMEIKFT
jgi:hypothetical protein